MIYGAGPRVVTGEHHHFALRDELDRISSPSLILAGERDPVIPIDGANAVAEALGNRARFVSFPDCGHGAWRDQPVAGLAAMGSFMEGVD